MGARAQTDLKRVQVDLNPELLSLLEEFQRFNGLSSLTEAVRAAISLAARTVGEPLSGRNPLFPPQTSDPLDLAGDFESSLRLVRLSRRRFYRTKDPADLQEWSELLTEVLQMGPVEYEYREQLDDELSRFQLAMTHSKVARAAEPGVSDELRDAAARALKGLPRDRRDSIELEIAEV